MDLNKRFQHIYIYTVHFTRKTISQVNKINGYRTASRKEIPLTYLRLTRTNTGPHVQIKQNARQDPTTARKIEVR